MRRYKTLGTATTFYGGVNGDTDSRYYMLCLSE